MFYGFLFVYLSKRTPGFLSGWWEFYQGHYIALLEVLYESFSSIIHILV